MVSARLLILLATIFTNSTMAILCAYGNNEIGVHSYRDYRYCRIFYTSPLSNEWTLSGHYHLEKEVPGANRAWHDSRYRDWPMQCFETKKWQPAKYEVHCFCYTDKCNDHPNFLVDVLNHVIRYKN